MPPGENGAIALRLPLPPGCLPTLWRNDEGYVESYLREYDGYYQTGDAGHLDDDGYLYIMSRTDDLINVAGHRLSTGAMEEILSSHRDVAECAVIGVADSLKGQVPLGLAVLYAGSSRTEAEIVPELVQSVRDELGPVASFKVAAIVERLPKTRSGKVAPGNDAAHRRRRALHGTADDRRSGDPRRNRADPHRAGISPPGGALKAVPHRPESAESAENPAESNHPHTLVSPLLSVTYGHSAPHTVRAPDSL